MTEKASGLRQDGIVIKTKKPKPQTILEASSGVTLPSVIKVTGAQAKSVVPGHVFRQAPFKFDPRPFATDSEKLDKFIEASVQRDSLKMWTHNPKLRMIYCVGGNPSDSYAKYFAAYLVDLHCKHLGANANPVWQPMYSDFNNPLMDLSETANPPSMIVLTGLTPNATNIKLEKTRDILEKYQDIPRVVVVAGMDPLSFMTTKLYMSVNGLAHFAEAFIKQRVEVM